jgi:hypothetical protein
MKRLLAVLALCLAFTFNHASGQLIPVSKTDEAFNKLHDSLGLTIDDLKIANDRLDIDIAKLQGKPTNNLALALDEARKYADKLGESLQTDIDKEIKLLESQQTSWYSRMLGTASNVGVTNMMKEEKIALEGTHTDQERQTTTDYYTNIFQGWHDILRAQQDEREKNLQLIHEQGELRHGSWYVGNRQINVGPDQEKTLTALDEALDYQKHQREILGLSASNQAKEGRKGQLTDEYEASKKESEQWHKREEFTTKYWKYFDEKRQKAFDNLVEDSKARVEPQMMAALSKENVEFTQEQLSVKLPGFAGILPQRPAGYKTSEEMNEDARHAQAMGASPAQVAQMRLQAVQTTLDRELNILDVNRDQAKIQEAKDKAAEASGQCTVTRYMVWMWMPGWSLQFWYLIPANISCTPTITKKTA